MQRYCLASVQKPVIVYLSKGSQSFVPSIKMENLSHFRKKRKKKESSADPQKKSTSFIISENLCRKFLKIPITGVHAYLFLHEKRNVISWLRRASLSKAI
jgi:hypothetical protein